jgi:hypothetical protein
VSYPVRVACRLADVLADVGTPQHAQVAAERRALQPEAEAVTARGGVRYLPRGARVIVEVARADADEHRAAERAGGELGRAGALTGGVGRRQREAQRRRRARVRQPGAQPDHAAERVGAVRHRPRSAHHLDLVDGLRVEEGSRRPGPPLRRHATLVEQDQGAGGGQAAQRRHGIGALVRASGARDLFDRGGQRRGTVLGELAAPEHGERGGRRQLDVRSRGGGDRQRIAERTADDQLQRARLGRRLDADRRERDAVGARHHQLERQRRRRVEDAAPVGVGDQMPGPPDDVDAREGER